MNIDINYNTAGNIIPSQNGREITMDDSPFLIFLSSIGMCAALYIRIFLNQRELSLEGVSLSQKINQDENTKMVDKMELRLDLPESFPKKYKKAIKMVVDQCLVKKHLIASPQVKVSTNLDIEVAV